MSKLKKYALMAFVTVLVWWLDKELVDPIPEKTNNEEQ